MEPSYKVFSTMCVPHISWYEILASQTEMVRGQDNVLFQPTSKWRSENATLSEALNIY